MTAESKKIMQGRLDAAYDSVHTLEGINRDLRNRLKETEQDRTSDLVDTNQLVELIGVLKGQLAKVITERDDLAAKLEAANAELHKLRIREGLLK